MTEQRRTVVILKKGWHGEHLAQFMNLNTEPHEMLHFVGTQDEEEAVRMVECNKALLIVSGIKEIQWREVHQRVGSERFMVYSAVLDVNCEADTYIRTTHIGSILIDREDRIPELLEAVRHQLRVARE